MIKMIKMIESSTAITDITARIERMIERIERMIERMIERIERIERMVERIERMIERMIEIITVLMSLTKVSSWKMMSLTKVWTELTWSWRGRRRVTSGGVWAIGMRRSLS
jgi:predicted transcriptional regulator